MGLTPQAAMAATASCIALSIPASETHPSWRHLLKASKWILVTVDVPMLAIHTNPVVATTGHSPGVIATREHLPGTETQAGACLERFLESVGCLHFDEYVAAFLRGTQIGCP